MPRSHPEGQHVRYHTAERIEWRINNADLIAYVEGNTVSGFLMDMRDDIRWYGWLTEAQTEATRRWMNGTGPVAPAPTAPAAATEATADDAVSILNGDYTLTQVNSAIHLSYKIHTVQNGPLAGKRIVKIMQGGGVYKGFAFLSAEGTVKVWRRFADDENRNERYIVWSHVLLRILREQASPGAVQNASELRNDGGMLCGSVDDVRWEVQAATRCRRCNRALTNPSSIDSGLGPECAARESNRTTAAAQHTHVFENLDIPMPTLADLAASVEAEGEADILHSVTPAPEPVRVAAPPPATPEERLAAQIASDAALDEDSRISLLARLGSATSGDRRTRFNRIYSSISYWRRSRICQYCGRSDFETERGCTNHQNNYCPINRSIQYDNQRQIRERAAQRAEAERQAALSRGPNLSQLGTVISGSVWVQ